MISLNSCTSQAGKDSYSFKKWRSGVKKYYKYSDFKNDQFQH